MICCFPAAQERPAAAMFSSKASLESHFRNSRTSSTPSSSTPSTSSSSNTRRAVLRHCLKENVQALPSIEGVRQVVLQPLGHTIPNQEGKKASVAIYAHLAAKYSGSLTPPAAEEGLQLYAEVVEHARAHPGSHPNIDILLDVLQQPELQISIQVDRQ